MENKEQDATAETRTLNRVSNKCGQGSGTVENGFWIRISRSKKATCHLTETDSDTWFILQLN